MAEWLGLAELAVGPRHGRIVARQGGRALDHETFVAQVQGWRAAFSAHSGTRFAMFFEDAAAFASALFGAWHAGKEVVLPADRTQATLARLLPAVDGCAGELPDALVPAAAGDTRLQALDLERTHLVLHTSGSSGQPLQIGKRVAQLEAELCHLEATFGERLSVDAAIHATVSHQHIYGLLFHVLWPLAAGRTMVTPRLGYPEEMARNLVEAPCVLVSSPAHLKRLPEELAWAPVRAKLQAIFSSGGPLPAEAAQAAHTLLGQSPVEVYGSTETGGVAWRQQAVHAQRWQPLPGVGLQVGEDDTLRVCSAHLGTAGWQDTADRAEMLAGGGFMLLGRTDRIVKVEEKRVSLAAVELALAATGDIAEARALLLRLEGSDRLAVAAVPSARGWDRLRNLGRRAFREALRAELRKSLEPVALPRRFRFVRELPSDTQGKVTEALLQGLFRPVYPEASWQEKTPGRARVQLDVHARLRPFDGHFDAVPVLPGVAQLDWAIEFAGRCFSLPPRFLRAEQLKFQKPVIPPLPLELSLEWRADAGALSFRFASSRGQHSSGRLVFGNGDV